MNNTKSYSLVLLNHFPTHPSVTIFFVSPQHPSFHLCCSLHFSMPERLLIPVVFFMRLPIPPRQAVNSSLNVLLPFGDTMN